jgi:hypothetical protein
MRSQSGNDLNNKEFPTSSRCGNINTRSAASSASEELCLVMYEIQAVIRLLNVSTSRDLDCRFPHAEAHIGAELHCSRPAFR